MNYTICIACMIEQLLHFWVHAYCQKEWCCQCQFSTCEAPGVAARGLPTTHFVWAPRAAAKRQLAWLGTISGKEG